MKRRELVFFVLSAALLCAPPAIWAKEPAVADLADLIEPIRKEFNVPAMGAAIIDTKGVTALGVAGTRSWGGKKPVEKDDLWHLGSCTKAMTATLVARLVQNGTLRFEDTLNRRLSKVEPKIHADYKPVTLELLLTHRGGAPADLNADGLWLRLWARQGKPREERRKLIRGVLPNAPAYSPGTRFVYSNAGFALAGAMAEEATNTAWEELMKRYVFVPLGMKSAGFDLPGTAGKEDQPRGHRPMKGAWQPIAASPGIDNPPAIGPAGTVHASLTDWGKFIALHLRGARGEEQKFLRPKTFERLHTPPAGSTYAMGWGVASRPWTNGPMLSHAGSNTMWFCVTWIAPQRGFAVAITCNAAGGTVDRAIEKLGDVVIQRALTGK